MASRGDPSWASAERARRQVAAVAFEYPDVDAVGLRGGEGHFEIVVRVRSPMPEEWLPRSVRGVPVEVVIDGAIGTQNSEAPR